MHRSMSNMKTKRRCRSVTSTLHRVAASDPREYQFVEIAYMYKVQISAILMIVQARTGALVGDQAAVML